MRQQTEVVKLELKLTFASLENLDERAVATGTSVPRRGTCAATGGADMLA